MNRIQFLQNNILETYHKNVLNWVSFVTTIVLNTQKVFQKGTFFFLRPAFSKVYQHAIMDKKLYKGLEYIYKKSTKAYYKPNK
jgi:uncharacterized protein YqgQ